jgi:hypothetical protein
MPVIWSGARDADVERVGVAGAGRWWNFRRATDFVVAGNRTV